MEYPVEPAMSDWLKDNIEKYYPDSIENAQELYNLISDYGMFICCDKDQDLALTEKKNDRLIELLIKACLSLSSRTCLYESEYNYMQHNWHPDWEICHSCEKRFTYKCDPTRCNPMDI